MGEEGSPLDKLAGPPVRMDGGPTVEKVETGISGFDHIAMGGLPVGRTTLVAGTAGTGKTVFAAQFLAEGIMRGQPGVFVTFEEPAADLRRNVASLGWDIAAWEEQRLWQFVDASPLVGGEPPGAPGYFEALVARIGQAVDHTAAERIALDSLSAIISEMEDTASVRQELRRLTYELRRMGLTTVVTAEAPNDLRAGTTRHGFEDFLADNVVMLRNVSENEKRRRTIEVLKMRGAMHRKGEYPFTILPDQGFVVIPLSVIDLSQKSTDTRITSGNEVLDRLCSGGFFRDSVVLTSGATGTGKTLMVTEFIAGGASRGERSLLFAFEESRDQIFRNARGWGHRFEELEREGTLRVVATYPEVASLEDHLVEMTKEIESFRPSRIAIDSLSALERSGTPKAFREFILVLTSYVKAQQICGLLTSTAPTLLGGDSVTDHHISTLTDSIILLRYVELDGEVKRGIAVLKMRGSPHDKSINEFTIDGDGMHIDGPFRGLTGLLAGQAVSLDDGALSR